MAHMETLFHEHIGIGCQAFRPGRMVHGSFLQPVKGLAGQDRTPGWVAARYGNKAIVEQYAFSGKPVKVRGQHHLASIGAAMQPGMIIRYAE